jgi:peptide/nickel transport system substrate-binding protein
MHARFRMFFSVAAAVLALAFIAANAGVAGAAGSSEKNIFPPVGNSKPVIGGTLKIVGNGDVDHLDTCCAYYTTTYEILRMVSRQLVSYKASSSLTSEETPTPDLATYSISPNGLTYTFTIRQGAKWDAPSGPRQITGQDEVNGIKRLCNPVSPSPAINYWQNNIAGMKLYCVGFEALKLPTAPAAEITALDSYMSSHQISGLTAPNASTVVFTLNHPASNFLNILALPMSSPVPTEVNQYLPSSIQEEQHFISDGPYTITSYTPNVSYTLAKNPNWSQSSDPIRHQYFNAVDITMGETATSVQQQLQTGDADLDWDTTVPPATVPALVSSHNKGLVAGFIGGIDYFFFDMASTTPSGPAIKKLAVRQALQYCVNKRHIIQVSGGPAINAPASQILPPQLTGYKAIDPYATTGSEGNPAKCKQLLAKAGYPHGLTLTLTFPNNPPYPALATAVQSDMAKGGVTIKFDEQPSQGEYFDYVETPSNHANYDIGLGLWFPDWQGNGSQSIFGPLLDGRGYTTGSTDYGDYNDPVVDSDIDAALDTGSVSKAGAIWAKADSYAMTKDTPWIPLLDVALPQFVGTSVEHAIYLPFLGYVDPTDLWVK